MNLIAREFCLSNIWKDFPVFLIIASMKWLKNPHFTLNWVLYANLCKKDAQS